eukprot:TRINITY_DN25687_c0_g1_i1.p1 TRINITY_DN25687_c0_g1~~TRINITY_DN25687_c0_g1_i1.p1  ORF type:complete len:403 (+),score=46.83 TRINITY_DN25687_c0_g1_i1:58-1266(+)
MSFISRALLRKNPSQGFRLFFIRHGESVGNVSPEIYNTMPDHAIPLTERGEEMARSAGVALREEMTRIYGSPDKMGHCRLWVSPYKRTRQTARMVCTEAREWITDVQQSPYIVEQDWGLFEGAGIERAHELYPQEWERAQRAKRFQGKFWARMPNGESCFDVCMRVNNLFGTLMRNREPRPLKGRGPIDNVVVVSHGVTIRAFIMMWCRLSPEWFEVTPNPPNCSISVVEGSDFKGYIFGGYGREGTPLSAKDVRVVPDPEDPMLSIHRSAMQASGEGTPIYRWTTDDTVALQELFEALDADGSGTICSAEAAAFFLDHVGLQRTAAEYFGCTSVADADSVDFETLHRAVQRDAEMQRPPFAYSKLFRLGAKVARGEMDRDMAEGSFLETLRAESRAGATNR